MLETVFGQNMPPAAKFLIAFVVVLALIALTAWLVRRFASDRFGASAARGRQPRLAVIDAAAVDSRRRLVLVRRDNVEHLLMIGGPSDIVVEPNILRVPNAMRDAGTVRDPVVGRPPMQSDAAIRSGAPNDGSLWPLQLQQDAPMAASQETTARPARAPNLDALLPRPQSATPAPVPPSRPKRAEPPPMIPAENRMARPNEAPSSPPLKPMKMTTPTIPRNEPALNAPPLKAPDAASRPIPQRPSPPLATDFDNGSTNQQNNGRPSAEPSQAEQARADQSLADMAQKLELALRPVHSGSAGVESKQPEANPTVAGNEASTPTPTPPPTAKMAPQASQPAGPAVSGPPPAPPPGGHAPASKPPDAPPVSGAPNSGAPMRGPDASRVNQRIAPEPPRAPAAPPKAEPSRNTDRASSGSLYDSLEKEMASLLGRPPGKN